MNRITRHELMEYANKDLLWDLNEFMVDVKTHLYNIPVNRQKPSISEIDSLQARISEILRQDAKPMRKY